MRLRNVCLPQRVLCFLCAATWLTVAAPLAFAQATVPYTNDFEGTIGSEWNWPTTQDNATQSRILGLYSNSPLTLTLTTVPGTEYELVFDLWAVDSWDGSRHPYGPDEFRVLFGTTELVRGTIGPAADNPNFPATFTQQANPFGYWQADMVARGVTLRFTATATTSVLTFDGEGLQEIWDESWGLDNLSVVAAGSTPSTAAAVPYVQTFETAPGAEWNSNARVNVPGHGNVLGTFANDPVELLVATTAGTQYTVIFDLWAFDSWDGANSMHGPDVFQVLRGSDVLLRETIATFPGFGWSMPNIPERFMTDVGVGSTNVGGWGDKLYRRLNVSFTATSATTALSFDAENLAGNPDESWAIDNVRVVQSSAALALVPAFRGQGHIDALGVSNANAASATTGALWVDLNGDGVVESVQGGASLVTVYRTGVSFAAPTAPAMQGPLLAIDADNDGSVELWHRNAAGTTLALTFAGVGSGATSTNRVGANANALSMVTGLRAIAPLDANADGWIDLALMGTGGNALAVSRGVQADGSLAAFVRAALPDGTSDVGSGAWTATGDINNDTIPDIYWSNGTGRLWLSDGAGGFTADARGISVLNSSTNAAGASFADIDNDRDLDLFIGRRGSGLAPTLWVNSGTSFTEQAASRGLGSLTNITDATFGDYDNDGDVDMFYLSANGLSGIARNGGSSGSYNFTLVDEGTVTETRGGDGVLADIDGDGDLDFSCTSESSDVPSRHWLNLLDNGSQSLTVRVIGKGAGYINAAGIGTRVELWDSTNTQFLQRRDIGLAKGAGGMTPLLAHFGGVNENTQYTLRIWGRGTIYSVPVTPSTATTVFSSGTRTRFFTFDENARAPRVVVTEYREAMQGE